MLTLKADSTYEYSYGVGGCQDKIIGRWSIDTDHVHLVLPLRQDIVRYHKPNLENIHWIYRNGSLRPSAEIDNGCFKEIGVHRKE